MAYNPVMNGYCYLLNYLEVLNSPNPLDALTTARSRLLGSSQQNLTNVIIDLCVTGIEADKANILHGHQLHDYAATKHEKPTSFPPFSLTLPYPLHFSIHPHHGSIMPLAHPQPISTDAILPMQDPYMTQITNGTKTHEFRKYRLRPTVQRIWFYRTAPHSSITHVCETQSARTRNPGDPPLEETGLGNAEFNNRHKDWDGYDFAYKMVRVWELCRPVTLREMREVHGFRGAPRGVVYLPRSVYEGVDLGGQRLVSKGI